MSSKYEFRPPTVFTPFWRRFTDERARDLKDTIALYGEVRAEFFASPWSAEDALPSVWERVQNDLAGYDDIAAYMERPQSATILATLDRCVVDLLALETTIFTFPDIRWESAVLSLKEQVDLRRFLRSQQHFLAHADQEIELLVRDLVNLYGSLIRALPSVDSGTSIFTVPLMNLLADPQDMVDAIIGNFHRDDSIECGLFAELRGRLYKNVCEVSGQVPDQEHRRPLTMPNDAKLAPQETADAYLKGTPILDLLLSPAPFQIPESTRFEHMHILAGSGHGKTQTLQHLILGDLQSADPPGMVIIDSQGDMIGKLSRLALSASHIVGHEQRTCDKPLIPDALFGIEYKTDGQKSYRFFALEADRTNEPVLRGNLDQTSYLRKILQYREIVAKGIHKTHWGLPNLLVLTVTTNERHLKSMMRVVEDLTAPLGCTYLLFKEITGLSPSPTTASMLTNPWRRVGHGDFSIGQG